MVREARQEREDDGRSLTTDKPVSGSRTGPASRSFHTIGHSTRSIAEFAALLGQAGVEQVIDVRSVPRSRTNPQYNLDHLPEELAPYGIGAMHMPALGGLRSKSKAVDESVNGYWRNRSFHNYADHALSDDFQAALEQLIAIGSRRTCALMCAEAVWWRCHRRIISDYLLARGERVYHLMGKDRIEPASMTDGAVNSHGRVIYPAAADKN